ncbi:MAG: MaoC family dehydratase [Alphaproteobacteria bacterium]
MGGPYFEDFAVGQVFDDAPGVTLTPGHAALHQALFGDRLRLALDATLSETVTGNKRPFANPMLVCNLAIGQTTEASQRVLGNLFYRGLVFLRPAFIGDTLATRTKVVGLRQNQLRPGRPATGMVTLEMEVSNQGGETVLHFWRCPMIACRDPEATTGRADDIDVIPAELDMDKVKAAVPAGWRFDRFRERCPGRHFADVEAGTVYEIEARDLVSCAPELARATLNMAMTHLDAKISVYGVRLVFGGHVIAVAAAQALRALPNLVTILAWRSCDHTGPVFEGDVLQTELTVDATHPADGGHGLVDLHAVVQAERGAEASRAGMEAGAAAEVLDWRFVALLA